jgi:hypothetical protein
VQAEEFATVNIHDCSLPWFFIRIIPDRKLPADSHIVFDPSSSGVKTPSLSTSNNYALSGSTPYSGGTHRQFIFVHHGYRRVTGYSHLFEPIHCPVLVTSSGDYTRAGIQ